MAVSDKGTVSPERTLSGRDLNGEGGSHVNSVGAERNACSKEVFKVERDGAGSEVWYPLCRKPC